ncbi:MAG: hypothetical protein AVDCRST_MAG70-1978 [uncultured Thermomicrobiales bacterium]|uniref:DUF305 domain-containing protein n=1 Tax=uncultured Thermomicrobiales bacterium TaxID=1645740 RepID=A0A6J4UZU9_9BACT|nr:MAG: hypothetical protein AVDCRST_MAG70-1978 [uncultured Thermomicrobiales bacterium]
MRFSRVRVPLAPRFIVPCIVTIVAISALASTAMPTGAVRQATPLATPASCPTGDGVTSPAASPGSAHVEGDMAQHGTPSAHTVEFDQIYIDMMVPHHVSVIALAEAALPRLADPRLKEIARAVITTQGEEIDELRGLRQEFYGAPDPTLTGDALMAEMARTMPTAHGLMVTGNGVDLMDSHALVAAFCSVPDADRAFIELVIPHHESAISASEAALGQANHPEIRDVAARVIAAQRAETEILAAILLELSGGATPGSGTPVAGDHAHGGTSGGRDIRALTSDEVVAIERGDGAGYARAAEANGIPGPAHSLELRDQLTLTVEQVTGLEALRASVQVDAVAAGERFLVAQAAFESDLRSSAIAPGDVVDRVVELSRLEGELAAVHLAAHVATASILTPEQIETYNTARGNAAQ